MAEFFERNLNQFAQSIKSEPHYLAKGVEKEGLRCAADARIARTPHPEQLGHALTHPEITTDYAESLMELITPVYSDTASLLNHLSDLHRFVQSNLKSELLWAGSMPCELDGEQSIDIAQYGDSNLGHLKYVYRRGLEVRYGKIMQSIAGMHYNFSLSDGFWASWHQNWQGSAAEPHTPTDSNLQDFKSDRYFALIRNFRRFSWLTMYLFGASPAVDKSFIKGNRGISDEAATGLSTKLERTLYKPWATSLRMGDLGYHNNAQAGLGICFNELSNYATTLQCAIRTPYPAYEKLGIKDESGYYQLNTNILQIENEYYSSIRPKRTTKRGEKPIQALQSRGVEYIEVRCLDLNPFLPLGVNETAIDFMDLFLLFCLLEESPWIEEAECAEVDMNFTSTVSEGRKPGLALQQNGKPKILTEWATELLDKMTPLATVMDQHSGSNRYTASLEEQRDKVHCPHLTPSAMILDILDNESMEYIDFVRVLSEKHQHQFLKHPLDPEQTAHFTDLVRTSFQSEQQLKQDDSGDFSAFLNQYLS
ncbi:MAG: glutamate--cysteine ligase [Pseudomonadales bacterium]|uniref:Glutamate--cysteine ligase n=1 Tax=Oleiphilus messinensis TaxID=141451 RepID=A0A1Y0I191_9GAMM|nr:glutamate--cysteine ligase [Oleiphilus messinensis]ARU54212.1 glutamate--cysteine ligase [Oleiphilus messinensis]MCG8609605.1 glutamate--cysteine ligase [Pseudomonadales bacterium]